MGSSAPWQMKIFRGNELLHVVQIDGALEVGRQADGEAHLKLIKREGTPPWRLAVVTEQVAGVSRKHALVEPLEGDVVRLTNLTERLPISFRTGDLLPGRAVRELSAPVGFAVGPVSVRVERLGDKNLQMLDPVIATAESNRATTPAIRFPAIELGHEEGDELIRWLQAAQDVIHSAATSADFFDRAARALVDLVDLDSGRVLLYEGGRWREEAGETRADRPLQPASSTVLAQLLSEKKTRWHVPEAVAPGSSLADVEALVASPLLDARGEVVGALYGDRKRNAVPGGAPVLSRMEARLVELLAGGIAAGPSVHARKLGYIRQDDLRSQHSGGSNGSFECGTDDSGR